MVFQDMTEYRQALHHGRIIAMLLSSKHYISFFAQPSKADWPIYRRRIKISRKLPFPRWKNSTITSKQETLYIQDSNTIQKSFIFTFTTASHIHGLSERPFPESETSLDEIDGNVATAKKSRPASSKLLVLQPNIKMVFEAIVN